MADVLAIKDFGTKYSLSDLEKKVKVWTRVPIPIKLAGEHFRTLMQTPRGRDDFAVFIALVEVSANMPVRGVLADERGPLSPHSLHIRTGIPEKVIAGAISRLSAAEIGWLVKRTSCGSYPGAMPDAVPDGTPDGVPDVPRALNSQAQPSATEPSATDTPKPPGAAGDGSPAFVRFWAGWPPHPRKVNRKGCRALWERRGLDAQADAIVAAVGRAKASRDWTKDGGQFIPQPLTWLNQERWTATLEPANPELPDHDPTPAEMAELLGVKP